MELDFAQEYILENERAKLIPLHQNHVDSLRALAKEKSLWTYFLGRSNGFQDFEGYVLDAIDHRKLKKEYPFAVFDKQTNSFAGSTRFFDYDQHLKNIRLGYTWYGADFRGTGLNKNCKYLLFEFAFEALGAERVGLGAHDENVVSIAAMKSVGCVLEGHIRNAFPSIHRTGRSDAILLGILKEEWEDHVKHNLKHTL
ncbi:MAG: GNAT family protein [Bacteroidota bacterium]